METATLTRRFLVGILVAGVLAGVALWLVASGARGAAVADGEQRSLVVRTQMLAEMAARFGGEGDALRGALETFDEETEAVSAVRVVLLQGLRLEASTAAADRGDAAAPRRLAREEKPLFDQAQLLRAAVENNADPSAPRKDEVAAARRADGGIEVAVPLERDGAVIGMVQAEAPPPAPAGRLPWWPLLAAVLAAAGAFWLAARLVGGRRIVLAAVAVVLTLAGLEVLTRTSAQSVRVRQAAAAEAVARAAAHAEGFAERTLAGEGLPADLDPSRWDVDAQRRPRGLVTGAAAVDPGRLAVETGATARILRRATLAAMVVAAGLVLVFGLGGAARLGETVHRHRVAYGYVSPAIVGMILLVFFPFAYGVGLSFTNQNIYNVDQPMWEIWVGIDNYVDILSDVAIAERTPEGLVFNYRNFYWTLLFTIAWTVSNVTIGVSVGLILALILNTKGLKFRPLYRVLLILPWAIPNYITALIWRGMFHKQFGVINQVVQMFGGEPVSWFESPFTSFCAVVTTNGWLSFPFMMVICLGALQSISSDLYEAARVDGASRLQQFWSITLPSIKPALVPAVIISVVWTFNMFNIIYLVSAGEPAGATEILITDAYKIAFEQYRYGYAAAYSTVIFGILLIYGVWQNRVTGASEGI